MLVFDYCIAHQNFLHQVKQAITLFSVYTRKVRIKGFVFLLKVKNFKAVSRLTIQISAIIAYFSSHYIMCWILSVFKHIDANRCCALLT